MLVRYITLRTKLLSRHIINSSVVRPFHASISRSRISFYDRLKGIFSTRPTKTPAAIAEKVVPYFDSSIKIDPGLAKTHACEQVIGYQFHEPLLLWEALQAYNTHAHLPRYVEGNKRLAIIGDYVLDLLLALKWYPTWANRGAFSILREKVTSNDSLERTGKINKLRRFIVCPDGSFSITQRVTTATVEAIVGAAYLDGGMNAAETVAQNLGINGVEGAVPKASFNIRTRLPPAQEPLEITRVLVRKERRRRKYESGPS